MSAEVAERRTKRRYAHELYPHPDEWEVQPLEVAVPYLYARAIGLDVHGSGWMESKTKEDYRAAGDRTSLMIAARSAALHADALLQGLAGTEAWQWAEERASDETGEWIGERARHYGIDWNAIKPYLCGEEPNHHDHHDDPDAHGWRIVRRVDGKESECLGCTEPVEAVQS